MILDEIVLHNFGLYADRQTLTVTPPSPSKPVVLIGGLNGGGKTTLLDALQLCLYGPHARISNRASLAYHDYLARSIHRGATSSEAAVEIAFRHTVDGAQEHYRLHRSWRVTASGCKEHFEVLRNGRLEPALAENWISQVDELMPANIAHLFLFDGEQIESYASLANSSALIGAAIENLLGLDVVEQLEKDLQIFERRKRVEDKDDILNAEIEAAEEELRGLRARRESVTQDRAALRTHKIDQTRKALIKLDEQFRKLGGELYEQRADLERQMTDAEAALTRTETILRELAAGALPLALVRDLLQSVAARDQAEERGRHAREVVQTLKERDTLLIKFLRRQKIGDETLSSVKAFLQDDLALREQHGSATRLLEIGTEARSDLQWLLAEGLESTGREAAMRLVQYDDEADRDQRMRGQFGSVPSHDTIAGLASQRETLRENIKALEAQHANLNSELERLGREIERKEQSLTRLLEAGAGAAGQRQDRLRVLRHVTKVRATMGAFRHAVTARHVRRIEQLVLESYKQLLRKASLISRLTINPETFDLTLYGRDDRVLSAERLSAGERQLLAIALLWGLAKASGRPLPMAIDTPLGRLDTDHRIHLVERYFPFASHQVLLLSTNEEIADDYLRRLDPWIGRKYQLIYDDTTGQTRIEPGYFPMRLAA